MNGEYKINDVVLGNWTLVKLLGEGAYGKVYEAHREDFGTTYKAAIKIMTIPQSQSEVISARAEGMDDESVTSYFRSFVEDVVQEFALMSKLKGTANIVSYEDHSVTEHSGNIGWDILIRMELLTPMLNHMARHQMTRSDIIKLGIDMCKALELCQRYNIIHRDIKPENIFISETGDYKLGDFGVARTLEKTTGGLSKKGTYTYMAPEIYKDEKYGSTVDIYSLGIVLYRLLNNNRAPFLPAPPNPITHSERERALVRRISGETLPPPANAEGRLAEIVLKACAYNPKDRYSSPVLMRQELEAIQYQRGEDSVIYGRSGKIDVNAQDYTRPVSADDDEKTVFDNREQHKTATVIEDDKTVFQPHNQPVAYTADSSEEAGEKTVFKNTSPDTGNAAVKADENPAPIAKKKTGLIAGLSAAALALIVLVFVLLPKGAKEAPAAASVQETAPAQAEETAPQETEQVTAEETPAAQPENTKAPNDENTSVTVENLSDFSGSWSNGSLRAFLVNENRLGIEISDYRLAEDYVMTEEPGDENAPCWRFTVTLNNGDTWGVETFLGIDLALSDNTTHDYFRSEGASLHGFVQKGNTSIFDVIFDNPNYSLEDVHSVSVQMNREFLHGRWEYTDNHEFVFDLDWHELPITVQGDGYQILSCRYLGGPEIEKIEFFTYGGDNGSSVFNVHFVDNTRIAAIVGAVDTGLPLSDEDIEMWRPFGEKYLREMDIPGTPQNPVSILYGPLYNDSTPRDMKDYLLWFGADSNGEIKSTIVVEMGFAS